MSWSLADWLTLGVWVANFILLGIEAYRSPIGWGGLLKSLEEWRQNNGDCR